MERDKISQLLLDAAEARMSARLEFGKKRSNFLRFLFHDIDLGEDKINIINHLSAVT
jgi:hypothetical protein